MTTEKPGPDGRTLWHIDAKGEFIWGSASDRDRTSSEQEKEALQQIREQAARDMGIDPDIERAEAQAREPSR